MYISSITNRGATPALIKTLAFNEAKLNMIAENVANIHTPHYRTKHLDTHAFKQSLKKALDNKGRDPNQPFVVNVDDQVQTLREGTLQVTPSVEPVENILFHDGTNQSIEHQMSELAKTGMMHELATTLLRGDFAGLRKAIRGTV